MEITTSGGPPIDRVPARIPVEYVAAIKALQACQSIDDAKYWNDKSDALAAWARIYHSDKAVLEARKLKLHAYRRMGELARQLRPGGVASARLPNPTKSGKHRFQGRLPGPTSILLEQGLNKGEVQSALRVSRIRAEEFEALVNLPRPPSPGTIGMARIGVSREYQLFLTCFMSTRSFCRKRSDVATFAKDVPTGDVPIIRKLCVEIMEWLDGLEGHLPSAGVKDPKSRLGE